MNNRKKSGLLLLVIACLLWAACTQERDPCLEPKIVALHMGAYRFADTGTALLDTLLINPIVAAIDRDTSIATALGTKDLSKFSVFLSPKVDSSRWIVQTDSALSSIDTLTFYYQRQLQFLSNACGYTYYYNLLRVTTTHHDIDSIIINNSTVNSNASTEHVKILY